MDEFGLEWNGLFSNGELMFHEFLARKNKKKITLKSDVYLGVSSPRGNANQV